MQICQIPHVNFENTCPFFFRVCIKTSVPSNITPLYFFSSNITYFGQRSQLKSKFFRFSSALSKFIVFFMSILKHVNSFSIFASFFIVMTHYSSANFKLICFLFSTKGSHQSTFECSGENFPYSSCHF